VGLDIAEDMLQQARAKWPQFHALLHYDFEDPLAKVGLAEKSFDLVISCGALHFAQVLEKTLVDLRSMLSPGGVLAFTYIPVQHRAFSSATHLHEVPVVENLVRGLDLQIIDHQSFVAYYEGGNRADPVIYQRLVSRCPKPARPLPKALENIDRCACVDRERLYRLGQRPLMATRRVTGQSDASTVHYANQQLLQVLHRQIETDNLETEKLPLPDSTAQGINSGEPHCDVLLLTAHPDDETVYAGGLIAGLTEAGQRVHLVVATNGAGGRQSQAASRAEHRLSELRHAAKTLGIASVEQLDFADFGKYRDQGRSQPITAADTLRRWGLEPTLDVAVTAIRRHRPRVLLTFDPNVDPNYSLHGHHLAIGVAGLVAFHLAADKAYTDGAQLEPWAVPEQRSLVPRYQPGEGIVAVEVDPQRKLAALRCYPSQQYSIEGLITALQNKEPSARFESYRIIQVRHKQFLPTAIALCSPSTNSELSAESACLPLNAQQWRATYEALCSRGGSREALVKVLRQQATKRGAGQTVLNNIERLRASTTVAVVTGQQVGLFGGPVFTLYKALGAVAQADRLNALGIPAVPVFWLASYDHDLDEVQRMTLSDPCGAQQVLTLGLPIQGKPVGDLPLGGNIDGLLHQAESILNKHPYGHQVLAQLRQCYRPDATLTEAFSGWLGFLTDSLGLVIVDPSSRTLAALTRPIIERALFDATGCQRALAQERARLLAKGQTETVNTERDILQVFFTDEKGRRRRLKPSKNGFVLQGRGGSLSENEVRQLLNTQPERFTPSVLLRPLCQDALLSTIAYVAGPTEQRYLEQITELYKWADLTKPYVAPRPSFNLINAVAADALAEAGGVTALLGDSNPWVPLGRSGLPETVKSVWDSLTTLEERCYRLANRFRGNPSVMVSAQSLEKDIATQLNLLSTVLMNWNKPRPRKALNCAVAQVSEWLLALRWEIKSVQYRGKPPSTWPLVKLARVLGSLGRTLLQEGRRQNALGVVAWKQVGLHKHEQERRMSIAEVVARYGVSVIPHLLSMVRSDAVTGLVTLRETDGW
jgi:bacillithiol biosynthesis cysteine-adding enzyme BshC